MFKSTGGIKGLEVRRPVMSRQMSRGTGRVGCWEVVEGHKVGWNMGTGKAMAAVSKQDGKVGFSVPDLADLFLSSNPSPLHPRLV